MLEGIQYYVKCLTTKIIYLYKFSVYTLYLLEKTILGPESDDSDNDDDVKYYTGRTPLEDDIENTIIPKLE
jgi:hypothetical protein